MYVGAGSEPNIRGLQAPNMKEDIPEQDAPRRSCSCGEFKRVAVVQRCHNEFEEMLPVKLKSKNTANRSKSIHRQVLMASFILYFPCYFDVHGGFPLWMT